MFKTCSCEWDATKYRLTMPTQAGLVSNSFRINIIPGIIERSKLLKVLANTCPSKERLKFNLCQEENSQIVRVLKEIALH